MTSDKKTRTHILAFFSDTHCGSALGLCPPSWTLDDGGTYKPSRGQLWVWSRYVRFRAQLASLKEDHPGAYVTLVGNGDIVEGVHHKTTQLVSNNTKEHTRMAVACLDPLVQLADEFFMTRGTSVHVGESAKLEEYVAKDLGAIRPKGFTGDEGGPWTHWTLDLVRHGVTFNVAHHGRIGRLAWTRMNGLQSAAAHYTMECLKVGRKPPDFIIRSHNHIYVDTGQALKWTRAVGLPGFQLATGFVNRIDPGALGDVGWMTVVVHPPDRPRAKGRPEVKVDWDHPAPEPYRKPIDE